MASISGTSGSSYTSSLYNSANIISGLASGLDTEGMIESLVQSYQTKLQDLSNKSTKIGWKQDAYRSIISKMTAFSTKYTSYTSSTNLMSASFFNNAVKVNAKGANASKVSASGRTDSDVRIDSVSQLATSARYVAKTNMVGSGEDYTVHAEKGLDLNSDMDIGTLSGSLSFTYGSQTVSISFDGITDQITGDKGKSRAEELADVIRDKLKDQKITLSSGETATASDRIKVETDADGNISFSDASTAKNNVFISSASDSIKAVFGLGDLATSGDNTTKSLRVTSSTPLMTKVNTGEYLSGKSFNINLDGTTKTVRMPKIEKVEGENGAAAQFKFTTPTTVKDKYGNTGYIYGEVDTEKYTVVKEGKTETVSADKAAEKYIELFNQSLKENFGNKVSVENLDKTGKTLQLSFNAPANSNLLINNDAGDVLGIGKTATNYLNTSKTLGELLGDDVDFQNYLKSEDGKADFIINGVTVGRFGADDKLSDVMTAINSNSEAGVKVTYSQTTREFVFTSKETGSENEIKLEGLSQTMFGRNKDFELKETEKIKDILGMSSADQLKDKKFEVEFQNGEKVSFEFIGEGGSMKDLLGRVDEKLSSGMKASFDDNGALVIKDAEGNTYGVSGYGKDDEIAQKLAGKITERSGVSYTAGQDAKFTATINGTTKEMTRGTNSINIDGMTVNLKGTFEADGEGVTFERSTDSEKIIDAVRSMVEDYNAMMSEIRTQYATMPYQNSSGAFQTYEPLSDEDRATMSESAIQNYEEKAKQGLLFGDSNLSNLYERMRGIFAVGGADGALLSKIGITVGYDSSSGASTLVLDESKLKEALDNDPDSVADLFTRSAANGAESDGLMQGLKTQLDRYAGLTGATKGILVQQAGTPLNSSSLLSNEWQKEMDNIATQIEKWQDKLEAQVDRYTSMFSKLEVLINQMNSQSSTLAGLMGG